MGAVEIVSPLCEFDGRGAGSDAERRAARWLALELRRSGHDTHVEPLWCRPNWALAHAWHVGLGLVGGLLAVGTPAVGAALIGVVLLSVISDALLGLSLGRRLTPERASQNVVARARLAERIAGQQHAARLILTANYDAGRTALLYRSRFRVASASLKRVCGGLTPGWLGWLAIALIWLELTAVARGLGSRGTLIGAVQLPPMIALVAGLALLLDAASAGFGPAAGDNATGVAVAMAMARALDAAPPRHVAVELVLQGASDSSPIGLRSYLKTRRSALPDREVVVLGVGPCSAGAPCWWISDGPLAPLRPPEQLRALCQRAAEQDPGLGARAHRGRGSSPAWAARLKRLPAVSIGCIDDRGTVPGSHQPTDTPEMVDSAALDRALAFGLLLVDAIDGFLALGSATPANRSALTVTGDRGV